MAEYIERVPFAELIEHLDKKEPCRNCYHRAACDAWVRNATTLYDDYLYSVENCPYYKPTADVVEVKHGYYERVSEDTYRCSICHCSPIADINNKWAFTNYCGNCGAKIDKRREDK